MLLACFVISWNWLNIFLHNCFSCHSLLITAQQKCLWGVENQKESLCSVSSTNQWFSGKDECNHTEVCSVCLNCNNTHYKIMLFSYAILLCYIFEKINICKWTYLKSTAILQRWKSDETILINLWWYYLFRALCKLVGNNPKEWDMHLDAVMFGLRTKKQMTTNFSPFYMMFGREARYPSLIPEQYQVSTGF